LWLVLQQFNDGPDKRRTICRLAEYASIGPPALCFGRIKPGVEHEGHSEMREPTAHSGGALSANAQADHHCGERGMFGEHPRASQAELRN
jgi:hypothetical protein